MLRRRCELSKNGQCTLAKKNSTSRSACTKGEFDAIDELIDAVERALLLADRSDASLEIRRLAAGVWWGCGITVVIDCLMFLWSPQQQRCARRAAVCGGGACVGCWRTSRRRVRFGGAGRWMLDVDSENMLAHWNTPVASSGSMAC